MAHERPTQINASEYRDELLKIMRVEIESENWRSIDDFGELAGLAGLLRESGVNFKSYSPKSDGRFLAEMGVRYSHLVADLSDSFILRVDISGSGYDRLFVIIGEEGGKGAIKQKGALLFSRDFVDQPEQNWLREIRCGYDGFALVFGDNPNHKDGENKFLLSYTRTFERSFHQLKS